MRLNMRLFYTFHFSLSLYSTMQTTQINLFLCGIAEVYDSLEGVARLAISSSDQRSDPIRSALGA